MRALIEPNPIIDTFCAGIAHVERADGQNVRLYWYVSQDDEKITVAKLVLPLAAIHQVIATLSEATGGNILPFAS